LLEDRNFNDWFKSLPMKKPDKRNQKKIVILLFEYQRLGCSFEKAFLHYVIFLVSAALHTMNNQTQAVMNSSWAE
jgi:hypothetical protein